MMSSVTRSGYLFTASQWQELEHQALIYKYMVSGMPIPPDLLYTIRRSSLDTSLISSKLILNQPQHVGWNYLQLGFGKKIDPEPGRCRRTDGKKWRCSKEAYQESKYCERHMHRGRNRSRKPVEVMTLTKSTNTSTRTTSIPPTGIPISSSEPHHSFLYPHYSSSRPPGIGLSSHDHTKSLLDSGAYSRNSFDHGMEEEANKHVYYSEASGTMRSASGSSSIVDDSSWQLAPLTMGSPLGHLKQRTNYSVSQNGHSYLQLQSLDSESSKQHHQRQDQYHYYALGNDVKTENMHMHMKIDTEDHQPKKVMHHFFDELPREDNKDSWLDSKDTFAKTHLSISVPNSSHDFFITPNGK